MERIEYEECRFEVIAFEASDVIVTSDFDTELLGGNWYDWSLENKTYGAVSNEAALLVIRIPVRLFSLIYE